MLALLNKSTPALRRFLGEALPQVSEDWWNICVIRNLTEQQARVIRQKGVNSLDGLDLAALLRVFDASYYEISNAADLPRETRSWLKELQQVRNRWAHHTGGEERPDDLFRYLGFRSSVAQPGALHSKRSQFPDDDDSSQVVFHSQPRDLVFEEVLHCTFPIAW